MLTPKRNNSVKHNNLVSKNLSRCLRHKLHQFSASVTSAGYVPIDVLLSESGFVSLEITREEIIRVVESCEKQRFELDPTRGLIRAHQGHSESSGKLIDQNQLLTKLTEPREYCVHGTKREVIDEIKRSGLNKMSRTHIHFASEPNAISGFRKKSTVLIHVDMRAAMEDGIDFFISGNQVILSPGPIGSKYFKEIVEL